MHLSSAYSNNYTITMWTMAYHTGHDNNDEIELVNDSAMFQTKSQAQRWFNRYYKSSDFLNPEPIQIELTYSRIIQPVKDELDELGKSLLERASKEPMFLLDLKKALRKVKIILDKKDK